MREALELLDAEVQGVKDPGPFSVYRRVILDELEDGADDDAFPLKPQRILRDVRAAMERHDILVSDVGSHKLWVARVFPAYQRNTVLISNGFAAMGFALPAAIAAKLLHPERRVVAVSGDGGFLMNVQELETACRLGLGVVNVIFRDGAYNLIQWKRTAATARDRRHLREPGLRRAGRVLRRPRLPGGIGARAAGGALPRAAHPGPSVIDVPVDYGENARLTERLGHLVCPI